jgi:two-component system, CitB family, sensor kinase
MPKTLTDTRTEASWTVAPGLVSLDVATPRIRIPFAGRILILQIAVVTLVVGVGFGLVGWLLDDELTQQYGQRALAVARATAADPTVAQAAAEDDPQHILPGLAETIRQRTGALFVVVTDSRGVRLAHPNPDEIGRQVSTDPSEPLSGHEVVNVQRGTLGLSARGKVPLRTADGTIVGEVSVGFDIGAIRHHVLSGLAVASLYALGALAVGAAGSALLAAWLKRLTLGIEPPQLAQLIRDREAVLYGIGEGVLAIDAHGEVSLCNQEASRLLGLTPRAGGTVTVLDLPPRLRAAMRSGSVENGLLTVSQDRVLVVNWDLGGVLTVRDRTDLETLTRELDAVRAVSNALRAQRHEFANRLHTIAGLLHTNHYDEAAEYLHAVSHEPVALGGPHCGGVRDPYLQALFAVKIAEAAEKGVCLDIDEGSSVPDRVSAPVEVTTVVGNLVDNAVSAAQHGTRRPAWVVVTLIADGDALVVEVVDSGDGVPNELRDDIFTEGVSTRPGEGRGLGLALAQHVARTREGKVRLANPGGPEHGAIFIARLPGALETNGSD